MSDKPIFKIPDIDLVPTFVVRNDKDTWDIVWRMFTKTKRKVRTI